VRHPVDIQIDTALIESELRRDRLALALRWRLPRRGRLTRRWRGWRCWRSDWSTWLRDDGRATRLGDDDGRSRRDGDATGDGGADRDTSASASDELTASHHWPYVFGILLRRSAFSWARIVFRHSPLLVSR